MNRIDEQVRICLDNNSATMTKVVRYIQEDSPLFSLLAIGVPQAWVADAPTFSQIKSQLGEVRPWLLILTVRGVGVVTTACAVTCAMMAAMMKRSALTMVVLSS